MKLIRDISKMPELSQRTSLTIGNFDGVHLGHQQLIQRALFEAQRLKLFSVVLTFDPHPRQVLQPEMAFKKLFSLEDQWTVLAKMGVDFFAVEPFTKELAQVPAVEFFERWILRKLNPAHITVGYDFRFGSGREGDLNVLKELCAKHKVELTIIEAFHLKGQPVSSGRIRNFVEQGQVALAHEYLGRDYYILGSVERGDGRGKELGFATINIKSFSEVIPREGVYATYTMLPQQEVAGTMLPQRDGATLFKSVTSIGKNPTFISDPRAPIKIESHILNFSKEIYDESVVTYFRAFIRDQKKFSSKIELVTQIESDIESAKSLLE